MPSPERPVVEGERQRLGWLERAVALIDEDLVAEPFQVLSEIRGMFWAADR